MCSCLWCSLGVRVADRPAVLWLCGNDISDIDYAKCVSMWREVVGLIDWRNRETRLCVCCMSSLHIDKLHLHPEVTTHVQGEVLGLHCGHLSVKQQKKKKHSSGKWCWGIVVGAECTGFAVQSSVATMANLSAGWQPGGAECSCAGWGVNHPGRLWLCGHPGHSMLARLCGAAGSMCAAALPCSVSLWSLRFTRAWTRWRAHTASFGQSLQQWAGEPVTFSLIRQHLSVLRGKSRDEKKSNPFADFPCSSAESAAPAEIAARQYLTQTSLFL